MVFITADKGLCGGFNTQTIKHTRENLEAYKENKTKVRLRGIGRKGVDFFRFSGVELYDFEVGLSSSPSYDRAQEFINKSISDYLKGNTDEVKLVYNGYKNMITQEIKEVRLLPISDENLAKECYSMLEFEPADDEETILDSLVRKYIEFSLYYALLDSLAAEHSSRMQAMDNATNNAKDMVKKLSLQYNKARQEAITTELTEIVSGAEAMK